MLKFIRSEKYLIYIAFFTLFVFNKRLITKIKQTEESHEVHPFAKPLLQCASGLLWQYVAYTPNK